jgi:hypothetical protein
MIKVYFYVFVRGESYAGSKIFFFVLTPLKLDKT